MKRFIVAAFAIALTGGLISVENAQAEDNNTVLEQVTPAPEHDATHLDSMPTMLPGELAHVGFGPNMGPALFPEYATNCWGIIRSTRTSAVGNCYNYSGSGSLKYQIAALGIDACGRRMWFYGSVGWVYYPGKTTSGKASYVYSPGLTWRFYAWQIIVWKP